MNKSTPIVSHHSALLQIDKNFPNSAKEIKKIVNKVVRGLDLNVVKEMHHSFKPEGVTYVCILSESSLTIHTWPEKNLIHFDLSTCVKVNKSSFKKVILASFLKGNISQHKFKLMQKLTI